MARGGPSRTRIRINDNSRPRPCFFPLSCGGLSQGRFRADSVRPKSANTISHVEHIVRAYSFLVSETKSRKTSSRSIFSGGFKSLRETDGLAWATIAKMRGVMSRIYKVGILHEHVQKNPVLHVEMRSKTDYKAASTCDSEGPPLTSSLHAGAHLRRHGAPCFGDAGAAAGEMCCGMREEFGFQSAGRKARMARPRQRRRTDTFRCSDSDCPSAA